MIEGLKKRISRRRFFLFVWGSFFIGVLLSIASSIRFLFPNVLYEPESRPEVERPEKYLLDGVTFYSDHKLFVLRDGKGIYAMSGICTHQGCTIHWNEEKKGFLCPCHGSFFTINGKVTMPPARLDLKHYSVTINRRGKLVVHMKRVVEPDFRLAV